MASRILNIAHMAWVKPAKYWVFTTWNIARSPMTIDHSGISFILIPKSAILEEGNTSRREHGKYGRKLHGGKQSDFAWRFYWVFNQSSNSIWLSTLGSTISSGWYLSLHTWWFPKIGLPPSHHPFIDGIFIGNHPLLGTIGYPQL